MAASLLELLKQQGTPSLQTRKGLVLLNLQNDFMSADGKLPVQSSSVVQECINRLVNTFRSHGIIIWVRVEYDAKRSPQSPANLILDASASRPRPSSSRKDSAKVLSGGKDHARQHSVSTSDASDEELFLSTTRSQGPCCVPGSRGAQYSAQIEPLIDLTKDLQLVTTHYSALQPAMLQMLRTRFITEIYIAGCMSNLSVYATALDAAQHGIKTNLVKDCLGFRSAERHEVAVQRLRNLTGAKIVTVDQLNSGSLQTVDPEDQYSAGPSTDEASSYDEVSDADSPLAAVPDDRVIDKALSALSLEVDTTDEDQDESEEERKDNVALAMLLQQAKGQARMNRAGPRSTSRRSVVPAQTSGDDDNACHSSMLRSADQPANASRTEMAEAKMPRASSQRAPRSADAKQSSASRASIPGRHGSVSLARLEMP